MKIILIHSVYGDFDIWFLVWLLFTWAALESVRWFKKKKKPTKQPKESSFVLVSSVG